jgi:two-component system chemotaxis sensor kinase CheA
MDLSKEELIEVIKIFKTESQQYIQDLNKGFLKLEKDQDYDTTLIEELFRTAHSLKGAARMLSIQSVEGIAHLLEDILGKVKKNALKLAANHFDVLFSAVDNIGVILNELSAKGETAVDIEQIKNELKIVLDGQRASDKPSEKFALEDIAEHVEDMSTEADEDSKPAESTKSEKSKGQDKEKEEGDSSKTISVETKSLDALFNRVNELNAFLEISKTHYKEISNLRNAFRSQLNELQSIKSIWNQLESYYNEFSDIDEAEVFNEKNTRKLIEHSWRLYKFLSFNIYGFEKIVDIYQDLLNQNQLAMHKLGDDVKNMRLQPLQNLYRYLPRMVRDFARQQGKKIEISFSNGELLVDKQILEEIKDPLIHIVRNAIDHGIEKPDLRKNLGKSDTGNVSLDARIDGSFILITITDDGKGIDPKMIAEKVIEKKLLTRGEVESLTEDDIRKLIFIPGFSTSAIITDMSGRGVGLDIVRANIENLKGEVTINSTPGEGSAFILKLPLQLGTTRVLLVRSGQMLYAIPAYAIDKISRFNNALMTAINGKNIYNENDESYYIDELENVLGKPKLVIAREDSQIFGFRKQKNKDDSGFIIILKSLNNKAGVVVNQLLDEFNAVIIPYNKRIKSDLLLSGAVILTDGSIANVLEPVKIIEQVNQRKISGLKVAATAAGSDVQTKVLVVDDSVTTRTLEKNILEAAGYYVKMAFNGLEAIEELRRNDYDLVVSDVEMPKMNGFELIAAMKKDKALKDIPTILVTSLKSDEDKQRGIDVGANAYITKGSFDQKQLLDTINGLL